MFYHYVITVYVTSVNQASLLYNCRCLQISEMNKLHRSFWKFSYLEWEEYLKTFTAYTP